MAANGDARLRACLEPWLEVFQALTPTKHKLSQRCMVDTGDVGSQPPRILWMDGSSCFTPLDASSALQRFCEAVSLLTLLGQADAFEWRHALNEFWPEDKRQIDEDVFSKEEPVVVGVHIGNLFDQAKFVLIETQVRGRDRASADFTRVVELLAPRVPEKKRRAHLSVPLRMEVLGYSSDEITTVLKRVRRVIEAQYSEHMESRPVDSSASKPHFMVDEVLLNTSLDAENLPLLNASSLEQLRALQRCGLRPPMLLPLRANSASDLRSLLALDGETPPSLGAHSAYVTNNALAPVLLSALQHSPSIETVTIRHVYGDDEGEDEGDAPEMPWRWLAYSLFSGYATHKIQTLKIDVDEFSDSDCQAVEEVLSTKNPLAKLIDGAETVQGQLSASKFYIEDPTNMEAQAVESLDVMDTTTPVVVPIVNSPTKANPTWWRVWLPGCGHAWVNTHDVIAQVEHEDVTTRAVCFPHIQIMHLPHEAKDNMLRLLHWIGHETRELTMQEQWEDSVLDDWLSRAFPSCPKLEDVVIHNTAMLEGLQVFVSSAVAGHHKLKRLASDFVHVTELDKTTVFFQALQDPSHSLTVHLRELRLTFQFDNIDHMESVMDTALAMLDTNRSLHKIHLAFQFGNRLFSVNDNLLDTPFAKHMQQNLAIRTGPLALQNKLAFLSAISGSAVMAARELDSHVLANVFQFAAASVTRQVSVLKRVPRTRNSDDYDCDEPDEEPEYTGTEDDEDDDDEGSGSEWDTPIDEEQEEIEVEDEDVTGRKVQ